METTSNHHVAPMERPQHRRNKSSKFLRSLVSSKSRPVSPDLTPHNSSQSTQTGSRTQTVPLLPADHPHNASTSRVLGERHSNVQSPPTSPSKKSEKPTGASRYGSRSPTKQDASNVKKSKSSTSLSAVFGRLNRSSKDLAAYAPQPRLQEKENTAPRDSAIDSPDTPIWAQFASPNSKTSQESEERKPVANIQDEIDRYTPVDYSPSKQRNFNGNQDQPSLRPATRQRPQSTIVLPTDGFMGNLTRKVSNARASIEGRKSEDNTRRVSGDGSRGLAPQRPPITHRHSDRSDRTVSGSSVEQSAPKEKLNVVKRGARVMAAVAALQGKTKGPTAKEEAVLDQKTVDKEFEAVLAARNVPEPMRERMRTLTLRVKADFVRQDQGASKTTDEASVETPTGIGAHEDTDRHDEDDSKSTKRSRARSRTFTFNKSDKRSGDASPSKKARSRSKGKSLAINIPKGQSTTDLSAPTTPTGSSWGRRGHAPPAASEYITYLKKNQDPTKVEVGRLHKLRILLRNETVAWVDTFISQDGMAEVVGLLHRLMAIEWREEHEDQLLHETLLCLKGLCTTERALTELAQVADELFPALIQMVFDDEKKGPAEYTTRTIIINILFTYLAAPLHSPAADLEHRARQILSYLAEPKKPETDRPVAFVLGMHVPRPYKQWSQEVSNVTKEVFWIFLHHLNVIPLPNKSAADEPESTNPNPSPSPLSTPAPALTSTYTHHHFPGPRPPVPAAPYIGGVEWDATTYLAAHLDLLNGLIASLPSSAARNVLREELQASGFEKTMGCTLRTCKEKFYSGVHDGLRAWVAAAAEDGWESRYVREGPAVEEQAARARSASPRKKKEAAPQIGDVLPRLEVDVGGGGGGKGNDDDDGWLG